MCVCVCVCVCVRARVCIDGNVLNGDTILLHLKKGIENLKCKYGRAVFRELSRYVHVGMCLYHAADY